MLVQMCVLIGPMLVFGQGWQGSQSGNSQGAQQQSRWGQQLAQSWSRGNPWSQQQSDQQASTSCARPGYVYLECQEPSADLADPGSNSNPSFLAAASIGELQDECEYIATCVAFSTNGILYRVSPNTGKLGPFNKMRSCYSSSGSRGRGQQRQQCTGTYVFDGSVKQQTVIVSADNLGHGNATVAHVTSVPTRVTQQYVRGQNRGGSGRIGVSHCSLC